jgi:hypothetical protein
VKKYFYLKNGQQVGPFSYDELWNQKIAPNTKVWCEGMPEWKNANTIHEFANWFPPQPVAQKRPQQPIRKPQQSARPIRRIPVKQKKSYRGIIGVAVFVISVVFILFLVNQKSNDLSNTSKKTKTEKIDIQPESDLNLAGGSNPATEQVIGTTQEIEQENTSNQEPELKEEIKLGDKLFDDIINTDRNSAIAKVSNKIEVEVPKGTLEQNGESIVIQKVEKSFQYDEFKVLDNYSVRIKSRTQFEKPLDVKLFIDKNKATSEINSNNFAPAYYDEYLGHWVKYTDYDINTAEGSMTFKTNHLTVLGVIEYTTSGFYTNKFENNDCVVYYTSSGSNEPLDNKTYNSNESESWHISNEKDTNYTVPYYVQDIAHWMSEVKSVYSSNYKLWVPKSKTNVYVKNLGGADGEYGSVVGCIYFHNKMKSPIEGNSRAQHLKATVAHEYLHLIQDNYYVMNKAGIDLWWLEALAMQADRMVFENDNPMSEVDIWAQQDYPTQRLADEGIPSRRLEHALAHSWDKTEQNIILQKGNNLIFRQNSKAISIYGAGMFLQYLAFYRDGNKLNLANLLKTGGTNTKIKYYRTILDNYLRSTLSTNIGKEYSQFVRWLYQPNSTYINFRVNPSIDENHTAIIIHDKFSKSLVSEELNYLSSKIIKLKKDRTKKAFKLEVKVESVDKGVEVYLCERENRAPSIKRMLKVNELDSVTISNQTPYTDILVINTNRDKVGGVKISIKNKYKKVVKKVVKMEPFLMGTKFNFYITSTAFIKTISKREDDEESVGSGAPSYYSVEAGNEYKKVAEDNMGPDFSLTVVNETSGKTDDKIFSKETRKVSGSISPDIKTIKLLTIEVSYVEKNAQAYDPVKLITLYTDVRRNYKMVFENLPIYGGSDGFEYQKEKNLPHSFTVNLKGKAQIKKHLKSFSYDAESTRDTKGQIYYGRFSHFDWNDAPDNIILEIKIGDR